MYKKVLVSLDGSKTAEVVLSYARELAGRLNFELDLLHVCLPEDAELLPMCQAYVDHVAETLKIQSESLSNSAGLKMERARVKSKVAIGDPPDEILKYAGANNIDIIMLATHGRSKGGADKLGTVAAKVIHEAKVPVWLVPAEIREEVIYDQLPKSTILIPLDGSKLAEEVITLIKQLYEQRSAETEIVLMNVSKTVIPPPPPPVKQQEGKELFGEDTPPATSEVELYLKEVAKQFESMGFKTQTFASSGNPVDEIVDFTEHVPVQLVAMATHGRSGLKQLIFGSVAEALVQKVKTVPILLVRPAG